jgi:hypothetical protein
MPRTVRSLAAFFLALLLAVSSIGANIRVHRCLRTSEQSCCSGKFPSKTACTDARPCCTTKSEHKIPSAPDDGCCGESCGLHGGDASGLCPTGCCRITLLRLALDLPYHESRTDWGLSLFYLPAEAPSWKVATVLYKAVPPRSTPFPIDRERPPIGGRKIRVLLGSWIC